MVVNILVKIQYRAVSCSLYKRGFYIFFPIWIQFKHFTSCWNAELRVWRVWSSGTETSAWIKVSQASVKQSSWEKKRPSNVISGLVSVFHNLCFSSVLLTSAWQLLVSIKQRRQQRWWRKQRGPERSLSSASGWRRQTGSIWGSPCGQPPRSTGCPPRSHRSWNRARK